MLRIAILEKEQTAKDILFECSKILGEQEWTFMHFTKISDFAKMDEKISFDIVFFNEVFHTARISASFVERNTKRIVIYCMNQINDTSRYDFHAERILYLDRQHIKEEMKRIQPHLLSLLRAHKEYMLFYNKLMIPLRMQDIYYIEKNEKNLLFHTSRGVFKERKSMIVADRYFQSFDFLRIHASYLVNIQHITKIKLDEVTLDNQVTLPIARARKKDVAEWFHNYVKGD